MRLLFTKNFLWYLLLIATIAGLAWYAFNFYYPSNKDVRAEDTATVTLGDVIQSVTVSGKVEAKQLARLGFSVNGTVTQVYHSPGASVAEGDVIASLTSDTLIAEYDAAREQVRYFTNIKEQLVNGAPAEARAVANQNVTIAETNLDQISIKTEQAIKSAKEALFSTSLSAFPTDSINDDIPPVVTGNYLCQEEGYYLLSLYASGESSGLSYRLSGISTGTFAVHMDTAQPLGDCGLYIKFDPTEIYRQRDWIISIPNKRNPTYVSLKNIYETAVTERQTAIKASEEAVALAKATREVLNAPATAETIAQASANIASANAKLTALEARIADYTIRAPFSGIVTNVDIKVGETSAPNRTITIVYEGDYELKALVPEIDIKKIKLENPISVIFDADPATLFDAEIRFISPLSTTVSGVAYYEAVVNIINPPDWIREGLNADVIIQNEQRVNVPTLTKRYIINDGTGNYVLFENPTTATKTPVTIGLTGTNGLVEVPDLPVGTVVVLPQ